MGFKVKNQRNYANSFDLWAYRIVLPIYVNFRLRVKFMPNVKLSCSVI